MKAAALSASAALVLSGASLFAATNPRGRTTGVGNSPKAIPAFCDGCEPDFAPVWVPSLGPYESLQEVLAEGDPFLLLRGLIRAQDRSANRSSEALAARSRFLRAMSR